MQNFLKNEDDRRVLYEWIEDESFKSAKVVVVKTSTPIGDHYHNNKKEVFFLLSGRFYELTLGDKTINGIDAPYKVEVPAGTYHRFVLQPGSVLLGVASEPFDPKDEIK